MRVVHLVPGRPVDGQVAQVQLRAREGRGPQLGAGHAHARAAARAAQPPDVLAQHPGGTTSSDKLLKLIILLVILPTNIINVNVNQEQEAFSRFFDF